MKKLVGRLVRYGYVVRGIIYLLTGFYGLAAVMGHQGSTKDTVDILRTLASIPLGNVILVAVFVGLVSYGVWGLIRTFFDPLDKGTGTKGLVSRFGYFISGLSYFALSVLPIHILLNVNFAAGSSSKDSAHMLFTLPGGSLVVSLIGLTIIAGGIAQVFYGYKESFKKTVYSVKLGNYENTFLAIGRYGYIVRGVIYFLIGIFFLKAGLMRDSVQAKDPGDILLWTWQQGGGSILLGLTSIGLVALGIYSIVSSRIIKLNVNK